MKRVPTASGARNMVAVALTRILSCDVITSKTTSALTRRISITCSVEASAKSTAVRNYELRLIKSPLFTQVENQANV